MPPKRSIGSKNQDLPPTARSNRLSPSVTMSSPAASCALMIAATASRYCSRNSESPSADLNDRPPRLASYHKGRGYEPVIAVGITMSRVVFSIARRSSYLTASEMPYALDYDRVVEKCHARESPDKPPGAHCDTGGMSRGGQS